MKSVHLCVPVLRRYDLLRRLLLSIRQSTVKPASIQIIDNGRDYPRLSAAIADTVKGIGEWNVRTPPEPAGVAESWNWFLNNVAEERIIANDDMLFGPRSIERMLSTEADLVFGWGFSCFVVRDSCVEKIGYFDEAISPGYAYFEDCDYKERARRDGGVRLADAKNTGLQHGLDGDGSCTYRFGTVEEVAEHWRRYNLAHRNFFKKWGFEPEELDAHWKVKTEATA